MAGASRNLTGLVFNRLEQGEHYWRYHLFAPLDGPLEFLWRRSSKPHAARVPDLFDEIEIRLSQSSGKAWFGVEFHPVSTRPELARHYEALTEASQFSRILWRNLPHAEHFEPLYRLARQTFDAFATGRRPELVHLKALYRFARDEGYPVKEQWWASLPARERAFAAALLTAPVEDPRQPDAATARPLLEHFQRYLHAYTEIVVPPPPGA